MRVFISWSGDRSRQVADLLKDWIKTVVQASKPWVSTNIERGAAWAGEISTALSETNVGVLCITAKNKDAPWILFEAGALAKGLQQSRVIPLLIDIEPSELGMPLSQFNATRCDRSGITQLIQTINMATPEPLEDAILETSLAAHWERFESALATIIDKTESPEPVVPRSDGSKLDEVLSLVHGLAGRINKIENRGATTINTQILKHLGYPDGALEEMSNRVAAAYASMDPSAAPRRPSRENKLTGLLGDVSAINAARAAARAKKDDEST